MSRQGRLLAVRGWGPGLLPASQCPRPAARERPGPSVRRAEGETLAPGGSPRVTGAWRWFLRPPGWCSSGAQQAGPGGHGGFTPRSRSWGSRYLKHSGGVQPQGGDIRAAVVGVPPREGPGRAPGGGRPGFPSGHRPGGRCAPGPRGGGRVPGLPARAQGAPPLQARGTPCSTRRRARRTRTC